MAVTYLSKKIVGRKDTARPQHGMTVYGYTKKSGAPTSLMIRLEGEKIWRRVMCWQFSNAGTLFVRILGENLVVNEWDIPELQTS